MQSNIAKLGSICIEKLKDLSEKNKLFAPYIDYQNRLYYELKIIKDLGYENIFLITRQFINYAIEKGVVVGPGRGSAAGSLVCYTCGITRGVDPIRFKLRFERFLNPARVTSADIDVDFSDREIPIEFLRNKYGKNRVIQVGTRGLFKIKSALDEFARVFDVSFDDAKRITSCFDADGEICKEKDLAEWELKFPELFKTARFFANSRRFRNPSKHPSAVIVTNEPIGKLIPLQSVVDSKTHDRVLTTEWDGDELDSIGYTKFDILRVSVLRLISDAINLINKEKPGSLPRPQDIFDWIDLNDKKTLELAGRAELIGIFQLWKPECLRLFESITVRGFEDFYHATTVIRPGIDRDEYIKCHEDPKEIKYLTPKLEPILKDSYGIILYQEQMMDICHYIAGFTLAEADTIRKVIAKTSNIGDTLSLKPYEEKFLLGCEKNGVTREKAKLIWEEILKRQTYAFNLSHAVAYSLISFVSAYLKAHYPIQFLCACMNDKNESRFIDELHRLKIPILPPDINSSGVEHTVENGSIRIGLTHVKNVGKSSENIVKFQPYQNRGDFESRCRGINSEAIKSLESVGAFDQLLEFDFVQKNGTIDKKKRLAFEKELLGYYVSGNPLDEYKNNLKDCIRNVNEEKRYAGGILTKVKLHEASSGMMAFIAIQTYEDEIEFLVWPSDFKNYEMYLKVGNLVRGLIKKTSRGGYSITDLALLQKDVV